MAEIDISGIEGLQGEGSDIERELQARRDQEREEIEKIRELILEGETTRDPLKDLVIVRTHRLDQEVVELYRDLSARVAAHVGEPVMVIGREENQTSFPGPGRRRKPKGIVVSRTVLGVVTSEELAMNVKEGSWGFPTESFAILSPGRGLSLDKKVGLHEGALKTGICTGTASRILGGDSPYENCVDQPLRLRLDSNPLSKVLGQKPPVELEVFIGNAEIEQYLERDFYEVLARYQKRAREYNQLAEALGLEQQPLLSEEAFWDEQIARQEAKNSQTEQS